MFGSALTIVPLSTSSYVGDRLFLDSLETNIYSVDLVSLNQNHIVTSVGLDIETTTIQQSHLIDGVFLYIDTVEVGKPFVNPSIRRIIDATDESFNDIIINISKGNGVVLLSDTPNNYS